MMAESTLPSASETRVDLDSNNLTSDTELTLAGTRELTITPTRREREKRKSPATSSDNTSTSVHAPMSPTSSIGDTTFEPTIDMMVNDFDDEATLNEEEALAKMEEHNPEDEIARLREESEMPIEELLAKYSEMATESGMSSTSSIKPSTSKSSPGRRRRAKRQQQQVVLENEDPEPPKLEPDLDEMPGILTPEQGKKQHRSHLMDLYPDESFDSSPLPIRQDNLETFTPLHTLLEEVGEPEGEDTDTDSDDDRKIIMVGADYQADIPDGLSQYGDILPYENEDQLIWEPSQVTEQEVEHYLSKIQEARILAAAAMAEEGANELPMNDTDALLSLPTSAVEQTAPSQQLSVTVPVQNLRNDSDAVVKDNEQALHLLVQCGYDFKEALRRKRINILPLSDVSSSMGSWSEEECQKFEEGIHKFGKDFYQIRQNQVRTRTMRELVQFYYLWKKSERRDQSFNLNDTIDHMDAFLNETEASNGNNILGNSSPGNSHNGNGLELSCLEKERKKSYSIMTATGTNRKRRGSSTPLALEDNENDNGNNERNTDDQMVKTT